MKYTKQLLTLQQQIDVLKRRGLLIENEAEAKDVLDRLPNPWISKIQINRDKLYPHLCYIAYWLNAIHSNNTFTKDIKALLSKYPAADPAAMGFPKGWQNEPLWQ